MDATESDQTVRHTPGPWVLEGGISHTSASIDVRGDGVWVAAVNGDHCMPESRPVGGFPSNNEAKANAHLIVAAPDLYSELKNLYAMVQGECPRLLEDNHQDESIQAAITRAEEGDTPTIS